MAAYIVDKMIGELLLQVDGGKCLEHRIGGIRLLEHGQIGVDDKARIPYDLNCLRSLKRGLFVFTQSHVPKTRRRLRPSLQDGGQ